MRWNGRGRYDRPGDVLTIESCAAIASTRRESGAGDVDRG